MRYAFSLVELSIVLVILGLLTGGILAGQSLIRASELRSISNDLQRYQTSVYTFRDKYMGLPGDLRNATAFWGIAAGTTGNDATCQNTASTTVATCNGNGDGDIETNAVAFSERFRVWQHLANAGLVEGSYTGRDGATTPGDNTDANFNRPGINVPKGKIANSFFILGMRPATTGNADWFDGNKENVLAIQSLATNPLKTEEAWNIDSKLDDGRPSTGIVYTAKASSTWMPNCATTDVSATAAYNLSSTAARCAPFYAIR